MDEKINEGIIDFKSQDLAIGATFALTAVSLVLKTSKIHRTLRGLDPSLLANTNLESYPYRVDTSELERAWQFLTESRRRNPDKGYYFASVRDAGSDDSPGSMMNMAFRGYRIHAALDARSEVEKLIVYLQCGTPWARGDSETLWSLEFGITTR